VKPDTFAARYEEGFANITNIDISSVVVAAMKERYRDKVGIERVFSRWVSVSLGGAVVRVATKFRV